MKKLSLSPGVKKMVGISLGITITMGAITSIYFTLSAPQLPLFYSLAIPSQQVVSKSWLFVLPGLSLVLTLTHTLIMQFLSKYNRLIQSMFGWSGIVVQVLLLLALLRIIIITS